MADIINDNSSSLSQLPLDVLCLILKYLNPTQHIVFSSVCTSWRRAVQQRMYRPAPQLPWLLYDGIFFGPFEKRIYSPPAARKILGDPKWKCVGSWKGWLIAFDQKQLQLHLFNPINGSLAPVSLPPFHIRLRPEEPMGIKLNVSKAAIALAPAAPGSEGSESGRYTVVIKTFSFIWIARTGDKEWDVLGNSTPFKDFTLNNNYIYGLRPNGDVFVWNIPNGGEESDRKLQWGIVIKLHQDSTPVDLDEHYYLVEAQRDLYLIGTQYRGFRIWKLSPEGNGWVRINNSSGGGNGDGSLFLDFGASLVSSAKENAAVVWVQTSLDERPVASV